MRFDTVHHCLRAFTIVLLISAPAHGASLLLQWDPPVNSTPAGYVLFGGLSPGAYTAQLDVGFVHQYRVGGLAEASRYCFAVAAYTHSGEMSPPSDAICGTTAGGTGSGPSDLSATVSGDTVALTWTLPRDRRVLAHRLQVGSAPGLSNVADLIVGAAASVHASGVPPGTYFVRVSAVTPEGDTGLSNEAMFTVGEASRCTRPPTTPSNLRATVVNGHVTLAWDPDGECASNYTVYAGRSSGETDLAAATVSSPTLSAMAPDGTYYVFVVAHNAFGRSDRTNVLTVRVGSR